MRIWAVIATIISVIIFMLFIAYRRQVKNTCRHLAFLQKNKTNLRLRSGLPFRELNELADSVNRVLDISEQLRQEAWRGEKNLKEAVTNISHDIRTPLTSLDGYFQLLAQADNEEERQQYIAIIRGRIDSLKNMLEELFTYTKLQNDSYILSTEPIDFKKCVCDTIFSFYNEFENMQIVPQIEIPEERVWIQGNAEAIRRLVQNIIKNVLEHGSTEVKIWLKCGEDQVEFICENKVNKPDEIDITQVFSQFYKADSSRTHSSTGLGLAIAKGLAERMGGDMKAELEENWFRLRVWFECVTNS